MPEPYLYKLESVIRDYKPSRRKVDFAGRNFSEKSADFVTEKVGSWKFLIIQSVILLFWILANVYAWLSAWDPYPFIFLNLVLSFQAAFTAPIIMMSQNRQSTIDRLRAEQDYAVNIKAELEIELLHQKIDEMRNAEIKELTAAISDHRSKTEQDYAVNIRTESEIDRLHKKIDDLRDLEIKRLIDCLSDLEKKLSNPK